MAFITHSTHSEKGKKTNEGKEDDNIEEKVDEESVIRARENMIMQSDAVKNHLREHPDHKITFQSPEDELIDDGQQKNFVQEEQATGNKLYGPTIFAGACNCGQIKFEFHEDSHKVYGVKENVQVIGGYSANREEEVSPGNYKTGGYSENHRSNSAYKR